MFDKHVKRLISVILTAIIIGGSCGPTYIYAAVTGISDKSKPGAATTFGTQYAYREVTRPYAYPSTKTDKPDEVEENPINAIEITCGTVKEVMPCYSAPYIRSLGLTKAGDYTFVDNVTLPTNVSSAEEDAEANNADSVSWTGDKDNTGAKAITLHPDLAVGFTNTTDSEFEFYDLVLKHVIDNADGIQNSADLDARLNESSSTIGATTADLTNLNQRMASALFHYLNWFMPTESGGVYETGLDADSSGKITYESIDTITDANMAELLNNTLAVGHTQSIESQLRDIGVYTFTDQKDNAPEGSTYYENAKDNTKLAGQCFYVGSINSLQYLGILSCDTHGGSGYSGYVTAASRPNAVTIAEYTAALICLSEYITFYRDNMVTIANTAGWQQDANCQASLFFIRKFHDAFGGLIPVIETIYHMSNKDAGDKSLYDMVKEVEESIGGLTMTDAINMISDMYVPHTDTTSPISQFYTVNSNIGIVSYDRDAVLNDSRLSSVIKDKNAEQSETLGNQEAMQAVGNADYTHENTFLMTQQTVAKEVLDLLLEEPAIPLYDDYKEDESIFKSADLAYSKAMQEYIKSDDGKQKMAKLWESFYGTEETKPQDDTNPDGEEPPKEDVADVKSTKRTLYAYMKEYIENNGSEASLFTLGLNVGTDKAKRQLFQMFANPAAVKELQAIVDMKSDGIAEYITENNGDLREGMDTVVESTVDFGVSEAGNSSSYASVTMNEFIVKGMGYSANYIPMQTNVYNTELINSFIGDSEDSAFYNMYMSYGFMRKALFMDTSATAVMDYYNANGVLTNNTKVATLRDLLESGDKDIALYVDSNFYNAEDAIKTGNNKLASIAQDNNDLLDCLNAYVTINQGIGWFGTSGNEALEAAGDTMLSGSVAANIDGDGKFNIDGFNKDAVEKVKEVYQFDISKFSDTTNLLAHVKERERSARNSQALSLDESVLKAGDSTAYDAAMQATLGKCPDYKYINVSDKSNTDEPFLVDITNDTIHTDDNSDSLVLPSMYINHYMCGKVSYSDKVTDEENSEEITNTYTLRMWYSNMMSLAFVSCLYRDVRYFSLANVVEHNNPVFLASDDLVTIDAAPQWYKNTLLNYMLVKNLKGNTQIDVNYVSDLDNPLYVDIFGNILTESGIVVIPAACNATLHTSSFSQYNYAAGLYSCYGSNYFVPANLKNATLVIYPFFVADNDAKKFVINGYEVSANGTAMRFDKLDTYDESTRDALTNAYLSFVSNNGEVTRLNWMAMVKIVNEVMRGAPIEYIDKRAEGLSYTSSTNIAGLVAAAKLESLMDSLSGSSTNSLLCIPDFSRMDNMEYLVALFLKLLMVATAAVVIITIYRDGVAGCLGIKTIGKSLSAIALTVIAVVVIPAIFQLTYYSANKALLDDEALSILMVNEEKRQGGVEIGVTKTDTVESSGEFALQLDWITIPWYKQLEQMLYDSTLQNMDKVKLEAYKQSPVYNNSDIEVHNDGVYVTTDSLFDSVNVDFDFNAKGSSRALRLIADPASEQTASYYSPYYVFLRALTENVNDYNTWYGTSGKQYADLESAQNDADTKSTKALNSYNYSTKMMAGNRKMTVGLTKSYFESEYFMDDDDDILRLTQIYCGDTGNDQANDPAAGSTPEDPIVVIDGRTDITETQNAALIALQEQESMRTRSVIFGNVDRAQFRNSYWFNSNLITFNDDYYAAIGEGHTIVNESNDTKKGKGPEMTTEQLEDLRSEYINSQLEDFYNRVTAMNNYARDFVSSNKNMLGKVTDETFLKVMALAMAIKYNQLFGVPSANSLEIYNMDSMDLMRLCIVPADEAVMASTMSYPRFVHAFGGEASVYMSAVLAIILWIGSYIKPLCTVIVFISVFVSIFVFKVVLRKPSANLIGYLITTLLLCATNLFHAVLLKIGVALPNMGLSCLGCLIFITVGQVAYLLILAYVTGVSLRDWSNLGAAEYGREADIIKSKLRPGDSSAHLSGSVKHHDDNWDYYNDLVNQHRRRNSSSMPTSGSSHFEDKRAARQAQKYNRY